MPEPRLSLIHDGQCHPAARIAEFSASGVRAEFDHDDVPLLTSGQAVTASLRLHDTERAVEVPATVTFVAGRGPCMIVALRFDARPAIAVPAEHARAAITERRAAPRRVALPAGLRAIVHLNGDATETLEVGVADHSPGGIGLRIDGTQARLLADRDAFALDLVVAPGQASHALLAHVRHRTARDDRIHVGCTYRTTA